MTMTGILEENKEQIIRQLDTAATPDQARPVLEAVLDRMLYRYNENCTNDRTREAAAGYLRTARFAVPLIDSVGDVRVWERSSLGNGKKTNLQPLFPVFLAIGTACAAALILTQLRDLIMIPAVLVLLIGAGVSFFLAGRFSRARVWSGKREQRTECILDSDSVYRTLHSVMMVIDQSLDQIEADERFAQAEAEVSTSAVYSEADLSFYAGLLEALYSRDSEYAFEKLAELRYFLHTKNIDVVDYSEERATWFDKMPSSERGTLRPALASGGHLLRKGLASAGR